MNKLEKALRKQIVYLKKVIDTYEIITEILANPERFPGKKRKG